jgi:signal transduction histidine kinase
MAETTLRSPRALRRQAMPWLGAGLALALAIGSGILLAELLMSPPAGDLRTLGIYLTLSGAGTMATGWLAIRTADRAMGLSIQSKAFLGGLVATGVALLNVTIVAQLMFVSTSHDLNLLIALVVFSAVVTGFFSLWVARTITERVSVVSAAIRRLAGGDLRARIDVAGGDEVARLATDVNSLATRLQAAEEERAALDRERRELTTAISHDLRTPLASLRAMVEALDDQVVTDTGERERYYGTMRREIERLSRMIDDLFVLAQIDAGALKLQPQPVDLCEIAADVVDAMHVQAQRNEIRLCLDASPRACRMNLDGARMDRALANLLRTAIEHTPAGGTVRVSIAQANGAVEVSVSDDGEGIDPADAPRIWERFYRAEKSRRRSSDGADGVGLGLAIVRGIVEAHGGSVGVESTPGCGATFVIRLPA